MDRWKAEIVFTQDPDGPWVVAANAQATHAARLAADMKIRELLRELEGARSSERMSAAKHEAVLAQAKAAEARVKELESRTFSESIVDHEIAELVRKFRNADNGPAGESVRQWLTGRFERLKELESEGDARVIDVAHRHGWIGGALSGSLANWLDERLRERGSYRVRLNHLIEAIRES